MTGTRPGTELRDTLIRQFDIAWQLTSYHLTDLTTAECLWRPAARGLHLRQDSSGTWHGEWPDHEGYDLGPPSLGWITWHMLFWWSMTLDHCFSAGTLTREAVCWPGDADAVRGQLDRLRETWLARLDALHDGDLRDTARTRWPVQDRPFADVVAWVNIELTKNAAELGYGRFLHAVR